MDKDVDTVVTLYPLLTDRDVDAVVDQPACLVWQLLLKYYPNAKVSTALISSCHHKFCNKNPNFMNKLVHFLRS